MWLCNCGLIIVDRTKKCPCCQGQQAPVNYDNQSTWAESYDEFEKLIFDCRIYAIDKALHLVQFEIATINSSYHVSGANMTPQEELHASFFNSEKQIICNMSLLELRAHREELAKIAFEARARLSAVDDEERQRKAKNLKEKGPTGFARSLQADTISTDAINTVKTRQKNIDKTERTKRMMMKLPGMDEATVAHLMSAGTLLSNLKKHDKNATVEDAKPLVNPFLPQAKLTEDEDKITETNVTILEETNTIIIDRTITTEAPAEAVTDNKFNPFSK